MARERLDENASAPGMTVKHCETTPLRTAARGDSAPTTSSESETGIGMRLGIRHESFEQSRAYTCRRSRRSESGKCHAGAAKKRRFKGVSVGHKGEKCRTAPTCVRVRGHHDPRSRRDNPRNMNGRERAQLHSSGAGAAEMLGPSDADRKEVRRDRTSNPMARNHDDDDGRRGGKHAPRTRGATSAIRRDPIDRHPPSTRCYGLQRPGSAPGRWMVVEKPERGAESATFLSQFLCWPSTS